jgi:AraC family transcriptional regulator
MGIVRRYHSDSRIHQLQRILVDVPFHQITLMNMSRQMGVSRQYLNTLIRKHWDMPSGRWLLQQRLLLAHRILALMGTKASLYDVMAYCGFQSPSHFSRQFKQSFGMNPSQWASENR